MTARIAKTVNTDARAYILPGVSAMSSCKDRSPIALWLCSMFDNEQIDETYISTLEKQVRNRRIRKCSWSALEDARHS